MIDFDKMTTEDFLKIAESIPEHEYYDDDSKRLWLRYHNMITHPKHPAKVDKDNYS